MTNCTSEEATERCQFEALLVELSVRFINLPPDQVDAEIENAQRRICEFLDIDLLALWQFSDEASGFFALTHLYSARNGLLPPQLRAREDFPWVLKQMTANRIVAISSLDELPAEAARDREMACSLGIKSNLTIPLSTGSEPLIGILGFNTTTKERDWPPDLIKQLQLVARIFTYALARTKADRTLRQSEARLATAVELAGMGFYEVINGERFTFLDSLGRNLAGVPEGEDRYEWILQFWAEHIHPEDRPRILGVQQKQRDGEQDKVTVEYRYLHPQRGTIWIHHLSHILKRDATGHSIRTIGVLRDITVRKNSEEDLRKALEEVQRLRDRLQMENVYLREQLQRDDGQDAITGESEPIRRILAKVKQVAPTGSAVLITGETGTGKELIAQAIHNLSPRRDRSMIKVNCAALPAPLIEGELFGREKGAYTGAMTRQSGRFEMADGSTLFLDEIGDLPPELQTKLLRVLQDGRFERLGSTKTLQVDVRIVAATNHDLTVMVKEGRFRADLFHRLNVFPIDVPPLRTRIDDIPMLVWKFVQEFNIKIGRSVESIPKQTMERIKAYSWLGNVRELRNIVERAMIVSEGRSLQLELPETDQSADVVLSTLEDVEQSHIRAVLERAHWRISGKGGAAEILGLVPTTLHSRMKKLGITRPDS